MTKFLTTGALALFSTLAITATTVPANAGGGFGFSIGGGHHGYGHGFQNSGIYLGFDAQPSHRGNWRRHVRWCENNYASYEPETNEYFNGRRWRQCNSPFI